MTTQEIAARLVILCRQGQYETAQKELFATDAVSIEPYATPAFEKETKGLEAIIEKGHKFEAMVEQTHKLEVSEPLIATNSFACTMHMDVTMKETGHMDMTELCVYQIKDGKIATETFYV
ncbi:MAG: SnoaL-like domain-containing protein [Chitinophagaceae bacterium]